MKVKKLLVGTALLGLGIALVGCTSKEVKDDGKTTVRFSTWDSEKSLDMQQQLVDKFNEQHKDIKVVLEAYGSEYDTKISAGIGAKDAPDVMYMWNYPQYKDALEPLDSFIEKEGPEFKEDFYETTNTPLLPSLLFLALPRCQDFVFPNQDILSETFRQIQTPRSPPKLLRHTALPVNTFPIFLCHLSRIL